MLNHDEVIRAAYEMQPLPASVRRLATLVDRDDVDLAEIIDVVSLDPMLTMKVLRIANSAFSSPRSSVETAREAVIRLGADMVLGISMSVCVGPTMSKPIRAYDLETGDLWRHSIAAALALEVGRKYSKHGFPQVAFTAALLHDIGKNILARFLDEATAETLRRGVLEGGVEFHEAELEVLSLHHGEVGALVARHWSLPESIVIGIQHHHTPELVDQDVSHATHLANEIAIAVSPAGLAAPATSSPEREARFIETLARFGIKRDDVEHICEGVKSRLDHVYAGVS